MGEDHSLKFVDPDYLRQMGERFPELASALPGIAGAAAFIRAMDEAKAKAEIAFIERGAAEKWGTWDLDRLEDYRSDIVAGGGSLEPWRAAGVWYVCELASTYLRSPFGDCKPDMLESMATLIIDIYSERVYEEKLKPYEKIWRNNSKDDFQKYVRKVLDPLVRAECLDRWQKRIAPISPDREVAERKVGTAGDANASNEPARVEPATVDGVVASGSSKSEQVGGAVNLACRLSSSSLVHRGKAGPGAAVSFRESQEKMAQELPLEARQYITAALNQLDRDLSRAIQTPNSNPVANATMVHEHVRSWLWWSFMKLAAEWANVGLSVPEFTRQIDRVQIALLDKAMTFYETACHVPAPVESDSAWLATREGFRHMLAVHGRGWSRRNNERLLMYTHGDGQTAPLYRQSVSAVLRRGGNPLVPDIPKPNSPDEGPPETLAPGNSSRAGTDGFDFSRADQIPTAQNTAALDAKSDAATQERTKQRPGKERRGDATPFSEQPSVSFNPAEQYLVAEDGGENWPRLSIEAGKRILAAECETNRQLGNNVRPYTPGNLDWIRNRDSILDGGYRVIDFICGYAEALVDAHATEYDYEALKSGGILRERIVPLARRRADVAWGGWMLATAAQEPLRISRDTQLKPGSVEFSLPPRLVRATGVRKGVLTPSDAPPDPQLASGLAKLCERYKVQMEHALEGSASRWEERSRQVGTPGDRKASDEPARVEPETVAGVVTSIAPKSGQAGGAMSASLRAAARQAVVTPILASKRWTRGKWVTKAAVGKNSVYEYLDGRRTLTDENRKAMAEALGLEPTDLPE